MNDQSQSSVQFTEDPSLNGGGAGGQELKIHKNPEHEYAAICEWRISSFFDVKDRAIRSKYFEIGGHFFCLVVYPLGDSKAKHEYISLYLQFREATSSIFASYKLSVVNNIHDSKSIHRDSWHRFSNKKKMRGWCDFTPSACISNSKSGFMTSNDCVLITADIRVLNESFVRDNTKLLSGGTVGSSPVGDVLSGEFTWKVHNFSLFKEVIKTQKITSPVFPAGECNLRISVFQSSVNGVDYLSMCLESKDTEKGLASDRSCWCVFRMSVVNQISALETVKRDSYGRLAADNKSGDNTSLGWNDYMMMLNFDGDESGYLVDDTAVFRTSFQVIKEELTNEGLIGGMIPNGARKSDGHMGKFTWKIEKFAWLEELQKQRDIKGLCIKSRRFQIGNSDCRLIVYPRGQSQPPSHISVFLEVTDSRTTTSDWSCFVSQRLSVVNQKMEDMSVAKESQNRHSKAANKWGWREFVTLSSLFGKDSGFLVQDTVVFSAEVIILKETPSMDNLFDQESESGSQPDKGVKSCSFSWKVENFLSFKKIMETRKIFSKFFQAGGCELRIGVFESFDTICIYLESDQSPGTDPDKNFWVRYRMAVSNQNPTKTVWKESSMCTKTWSNSVLQLMKVSDMLETDAGFLEQDTVVFVCEILECHPRSEVSVQEIFASEDDQDALTTNFDEPVDSEDSNGISGDEKDIFKNLLSRAGFHLTYGDNPSQLQVTLREELLMDAGAIAGFLTGTRVYFDDPAKVRHLLLPTKLPGPSDGKRIAKNDESYPSLIDLLMGVKVLQQEVIDLLLDIMVDLSSNNDCSNVTSRPSQEGSGAISPVESDRSGATDSVQPHVDGRLDIGVDESTSTSAVQSSDMNGSSTPEKPFPGQPICPPESCAGGTSETASLRSKTKWPEQSEELLGLIVNSLRALDSAVPQGCPEPRRRPQSAQKIALVLKKAPKHLQSDLVALVPKLVEHSEHPLAAFALLDWLSKPNAEPSLRVPVFGALRQLKCSSDDWELVLFKSFKLLADSNDEPLAATMNFIFQEALCYHHLPEAVTSVRARLKDLGAEVSPCVLHYLSKRVHTSTAVGEAILRDIDNEYEQALCATFHFSDMYILLEMQSISYLADDASQTFERALSKGKIMAESVAVVVERCLAFRVNLTSQIVTENLHHTDFVQGVTNDQLSAQRDDFSLVLDLVGPLSLSIYPRVRSFVKMLYTILFKQYADKSYRLKILEKLVELATSTTDSCTELDSDLDYWSNLVNEDQEYIRPVLSMMREVAERLHICEERNAEILKEKAVLTQRLSESEANCAQLESDKKAEMDRFTHEHKELSEQLECLRSERDGEIAKLTDELRKVTKEKNTIAESLRNAEAARKRCEEELEQWDTENVTREEVRQSLKGEVRRLTPTVGQTEEEKREKEQQVAGCEVYIDGMKSKLQTSQKKKGGSELLMRQVTVGGFGKNVTAKKLVEYFEDRIGPIERCRLKTSSTPRESYPDFRANPADVRKKCDYEKVEPHAFLHFLHPDSVKATMDAAGKSELILGTKPLKVSLGTENAYGMNQLGRDKEPIKVPDVLVECGLMVSGDQFYVGWRGPEEGVDFVVDPFDGYCKFLFTRDTAFLLEGTANHAIIKCNFKVEFLVKSINEIREVKSSSHVIIQLQLASSPLIYYRTADDDIEEEYPFDLLDDNDPWVRTTDFTPSGSIGRCNTYRVTVKPLDRMRLENAMKYLKERRVPIKPPEMPIKLQNEPYFEVPMSDYFFSLCTPEISSFNILFMLNAVLHKCIINQHQLSRRFYELLNRQEENITVAALTQIYSLKSPINDACKTLERLQNSLLKNPELVERPISPSDIEVRGLTITPSKAYCVPPAVELSNRVLRNYKEVADQFLRVTFMDEGMQTLNRYALSFIPHPIVKAIKGNSYSQNTTIFRRMNDCLSKGFQLCGRKYTFLAFSSSQLRDKSAWFFAEGNGISCSDITSWMGRFDDKNVAKCAARMGQCFSATYATVEVPKSAVHFKYPDVERNGYVFSDGIGMISPELAKEVAKSLNLQDDPPCAYQIRFAGCKGVLARWIPKDDNTKKLYLRKSMSKFESDHNILEVCSWSKFRPGFLNRQIITLLSALGVEDDVFLKMQREQISNLKKMLVDSSVASYILTASCGDQGNTSSQSLGGGSNPECETYSLRMLTGIKAKQLRDLREKARIFVPKGSQLIGCLDESGVLEQGQCYIQVSIPSLKNHGSEVLKRVVIKGRVVIAKNPCLHPGDVRILEAVDTPELVHLYDCLVFPQNGDRPHTNEASGSDLDGDLYFVTWDPDLIPPESDDPMEYAAPKVKELPRRVTPSDLVEFFTEFQAKDNLGIICNAHIVQADKNVDGARSKNCIQLAELASQAVDFPKTGEAAYLPKELKPTSYPDFMEKPTFRRYRSEKILGKLYREAKSEFSAQ